MAARSQTFAPSSRQEHLVRGVRYNIRAWGPETGKPLLFLHGTQDSSVTFQFVVDELSGDWRVLAPDWRGHGHSQWTPQGYWFHEFVADLDALMDALLPGQATPIVGHSLGGNIAGVFAGLRPDRLSRLISLDGFGPLANRVPVDVRPLLQSFLEIPARARRHASYASVEAMAARLMRANPRLSEPRARFLAEESSAQDREGGRTWLFDPSHQTSLPSLRTMEEWGRLWSGVRVPVLWVASDDSRPHAPGRVAGEMDRRARLMPRVRRAKLPGTGHNLHHDEPALVAGLIERFIADPEAPEFADASSNAFA